MTVWQARTDTTRETLVAETIGVMYDLAFYPQPRYYITDFALQQRTGGEYEHYVGDLEVKWFNHSVVDKMGIFNYPKLLKILHNQQGLWEPYQHHRIALRYDDGILYFPASELVDEKPYKFTRWDTNETDDVIDIPTRLLVDYWISGGVNDERSE